MRAMEKYDFDTVVPRRGTNSYKWDTPEQEGVLPMWVADMDFRAAPCIVEALRRRVSHGVFGYTRVPAAYYDAVTDWFARRHGWRIDPHWILYTTGVVPALSAVIKALTVPGDRVIVQTPAYNCFYSSIRNNGCELLANRLRYEGGAYTIDFDDLETKASDPKAKLLLLCNPHNPVGRVWTLEELQKIGRICKEYGVKVVSDEIHMDFALPDHLHIPFLKACPDMAENTVLCTAPSKTFNLAGLQTSNIFIPGEAARKAFLEELDRFHYSGVNRLGAIACQAAYEGGQEWLTECKAYLLENLDYVREFLEEKLPGVKLIEPEGTYFAWLDFSAWGLNETELDDFLIQEAKVWLNSGSRFHAPLYQRVVLACPRATLKEAMERMAKAAEKRGF